MDETYKSMHRYLKGINNIGDKNLAPVYIDNIVYNIDVQNKPAWHEIGVYYEYKFSEIARKEFNADVIINPAKLKNKYAPDLLVNGKETDLKTQFMPFFTAWKYGVDPKYTFTFDKKDYMYYNEKYPNVNIIVWMQHKVTEKEIYGKLMKVEYVGGVYFLPFRKVKHLIENGAPNHIHDHRVHDTKGNAKENYLLDINDFILLRKLEMIE